MAKVEYDKWIERDRRVCARRYRFPSIVISRCKDIYLEDVSGKQYIDFTSGGQTGNLGHTPQTVIDTIKAQIDTTGLTSLGWVPNVTRIRLAEKLREIAPGELKNGQVGFCNTGSEAAELSMRLTQQYSQRSSIICHFGCFHGQTSLGALALNTSPHGRGYGVPLVPGIFHIPFPYCYRCLFNTNYPECNFACLDFVEYQFTTRMIPPEHIAAFFIEPIQVHGGVIPLPDGYLQRLRKLCYDHSILIVVDEVTTGFGRTGKMFATEYYNTEVDLLFIAKPMAAGMTLGAIISSPNIMSFFRGGGTFSGNPVACAASLANIQVIEEQNLLEHAMKMGEYLEKRLVEISESTEIIGDIRGKGLLFGVEIINKQNQPDEKATMKITESAARNGLLIFPAGVFQNVLRLCPPLIVQESDIDSAVDIMIEAFKQI